MRAPGKYFFASLFIFLMKFSIIPFNSGLYAGKISNFVFSATIYSALNPESSPPSAVNIFGSPWLGHSSSVMEILNSLQKSTLFIVAFSKAIAAPI
ncbi:hypothetical protein D3C81_1481220 [compost metagenome]